MLRTITVDTNKELLGFIDNPIESGNDKTKSELLKKALRQLINNGENSGNLIDWNVDSFLDRMKAKTT